LRRSFRVELTAVNWSGPGFSVYALRHLSRSWSPGKLTSEDVRTI
jgi:hypothetical protein